MALDSHYIDYGCWRRSMETDWKITGLFVAVAVNVLTYLLMPFFVRWQDNIKNWYAQKSRITTEKRIAKLKSELEKISKYAHAPVQLLPFALSEIFSILGAFSSGSIVFFYGLYYTYGEYQEGKNIEFILYLNMLGIIVLLYLIGWWCMKAYNFIHNVDKFTDYKKRMEESISALEKRLSTP
jgi:hypothetical protein